MNFHLHKSFAKSMCVLLRNAPWSDIIFKAKQDLREMTNLENLVDQSNVNIKYHLCKNYFFFVRVKISQSKKIYFLNNYD